MSPGQPIVGGSVSVMLICAEHVSDAPLSSVTVNSTVHVTEQPGAVSIVSVGVALLESSKTAPGQSTFYQE